MENVNLETGEIISAEALNKVIIRETRRANGSLRIQQDFSNCPSLAEQHTAHLTDVNWLMEKFQPDELVAYMAARNQYRKEIVGHDFSQEPDMQQAKNIVYQSRKEFDSLPDDVKFQFKNHVEFLKFIDNSANAEKMLKLGLLTPRQIDTISMKNPLSEPNQKPAEPNQKPSEPNQI